MSSAPHHHVFYALQQAIAKEVKIEAILPHLLHKKVIQEGDIKKYQDQPKKGTKLLLNILRNRSYDTFLDFIECILLAQREAPIVNSIKAAVQEFDERNSTNHAQKITDLQFMYSKKTVEEPKAMVEEPFLVRTSGFNMPHLEYVEEPVIASFRSCGGRFPLEGQHFLDKYYGLCIMVPSQAVPEDQEVKLKIGVCCYGPFSMGQDYHLASDFVVIVADGNFQKPVKVVMDHCLLLPNYEESSGVLILKASHLDISSDGMFIFNQFTCPEVALDSPELSFEIKEFCILCAVLDETERVARMSSVDSTSSSQSHIDDNNPSSARSSFDEDAHSSEIERSYSSGSQPSFLRNSSTGSESALEGPESYNLRKRKSDSLEDHTASATAVTRKGSKGTQKQSHSGRKRHCKTEYAALLFQSKNKVVDIDEKTYQFVVFVCINCGGAQKVCLNHAAAILGPEAELSSVIGITVDSKVLQLETTPKNGWDVVPDKTAEISKSEVQFYNMDRRDLFHRIKMKTCPPRIVFMAEYDGPGGPMRQFSCKVAFRGASTTVTQGQVFFNVKASIPKTNLHRQVAMEYPMHPSNLPGHLPPGHSAGQLLPYHHGTTTVAAQSQTSISSSKAHASKIDSLPAQNWCYPPESQLTGYNQLSQAYPDSPVECDLAQFHGVSQTNNQGYMPSRSTRVSLHSQDSPVLPHGRNFQDLSLIDQVSPQLSQRKVHLPPELVRSGSFHSGSFSSDFERDRASSLSEFRSLTYYENQLSSDEKNVVLDTKCITETIIRHLKSWEYTAQVGFGFTEAELCQLKSDYRIESFKEQAYQAYLKWSQNQGFCSKVPLTAWKMLQVLHQADEFEAISFLIQKLKC